MSYTELLDLVAGNSETRVRQVWAQWAAGEVDDAEAMAALVSIVGNANATAAALADTAVAATLTRRTGELHSPLGLAPGDESERLTRAAGTLLARVVDTPDPEGRAGRFGRCEPLDTAQRTFGEALDAVEEVIGWRRWIAPDACELCTWLEKDGYVYPTSRKMHHHTGCRCQQIMVTKTERSDS